MMLRLSIAGIATDMKRESHLLSVASLAIFAAFVGLSTFAPGRAAPVDEAAAAKSFPPYVVRRGAFGTLGAGLGQHRLTIRNVDQDPQGELILSSNNTHWVRIDFDPASGRFVRQAASDRVDSTVVMNSMLVGSPSGRAVVLDSDGRIIESDPSNGATLREVSLTHSRVVSGRLEYFDATNGSFPLPVIVRGADLDVFDQDHVFVETIALPGAFLAYGNATGFTDSGLAVAPRSILTRNFAGGAGHRNGGAAGHQLVCGQFFGGVGRAPGRVDRDRWR